MQNNISNLTNAEFKALMHNALVNSASDELTYIKLLITDFLTENKLQMTKEDVLGIVLTKNNSLLTSF